MFDAQAWYVRDIILGKIILPAQAVLEQDVLNRQAAEDALEDDNACIACQGAYTEELIEETDYPAFDVEAANQAFFRWKKHKKKGIMTFRDHGGFISPMDKSVSPSHHKIWSEELDDSKETYLK
jgi:trimethylamine monooxygenase